MKSQNGHWTNAASPFNSGEIILKRLEVDLSKYRKSLEDAGEKRESLLLKGFIG